RGAVHRDQRRDAVVGRGRVRLPTERSGLGASTTDFEGRLRWVTPDVTGGRITRNLDGAPVFSAAQGAPGCCDCCFPCEAAVRSADYFFSSKAAVSVELQRRTPTLTRHPAPA